MKELPRGVPHLPAIRRSLESLFQAIASGTLPPRPQGLFLDLPRTYSRMEPVLSVQGLAREVAAVYGIKVGLIVVGFRSDLGGGTAGRVEVGNERDFFVELASDYKDRPMDIAAILAHEVAHILLHRHGITLGSAEDDEILTDCAAVAYGFGVLQLDTFRVEQTQYAKHAHKVGYLTPDEFGLVLALCEPPAVHDGLFRSDAARLALREGRRQASAYSRSPPFPGAGWLERFLYRRRVAGARRLNSSTERQGLRGKAYVVEPGPTPRVIFGCPRCRQTLRLPTGRGLLIARCRVCAKEFDVAT